MSGLLEIRPAHLGDAAGITAIYGHYVAHTVLTVDLKAPSVEDWQVRLASLAESGHHVLVAVEAGQVLGYALVTPWIANPPSGTPPKTRSIWRRGRPAPVEDVDSWNACSRTRGPQESANSSP